MGQLTAPAFAGIVGVDGLLAQLGRQLLQGGRFLAAQEDGAVAVADNSVGVVKIDSMEYIDLRKLNSGER